MWARASAAGVAAFRLPESGAELPYAFGPLVGFADGNFFGQVFADHAAEGGDQLAGFVFGGVAAGENGAGLGTFVAQNAGQAAGVDVGDGDGFGADQVFLQALLGAEAAV